MALALRTLAAIAAVAGIAAVSALVAASAANVRARPGVPTPPLTVTAAPDCTHVCSRSLDSFQTINDWRTLVIVLNRGPCFGTCPVYSVEIRGDGKVVFEGTRFVAQPGRHEAQIPLEAVRALFAKFRGADFSVLRDSYAATVTDLPTYKLTLTFDGRTKSVSDYGGTMVNMPATVHALEVAVDEAAGTQRWIKP